MQLAQRQLPLQLWDVPNAGQMLEGADLVHGVRVHLCAGGTQAAAGAEPGQNCGAATPQDPRDKIERAVEKLKRRFAVDYAAGQPLHVSSRCHAFCVAPDVGALAVVPATGSYSPSLERTVVWCARQVGRLAHVPVSGERLSSKVAARRPDG